VDEDSKIQLRGTQCSNLVLLIAGSTLAVRASPIADGFSNE
jgi:hypothetical protein